MLKWIRNLIGVLSLLYLGWMFLSCMDIAMHNLDPNPVYHSWNFFTL